MYAKVNPTGCAERYGLVQVRLGLFLEEGDARYDDLRFYQIDPTSKAYVLGYQGLVDKDGTPLDPEAYAAWEASLPRVWLAERCFHSHFIYLDPYTLRDEQIEAAIQHHLPNFYKAWTEEWDKVPGGMRHGWDVASRKPRPERINKTRPELYDSYKAESLGKLTVLKANLSTFSAQAKGIGETFPSTDIDIGDAAVDRGSIFSSTGFTILNRGNAANGTGSIDTIEVFGGGTVDIQNFVAGTFSGSGTTWTNRDYETIGDVTRNAKRTFSGLDCDVTTSDIIGCRYSNGAIERDTSGYSGILHKLTDAFGAGEVSGYNQNAPDDAISLYGTGEMAAPTVTTQAVDNVQPEQADGNGNITDTGGEDCTKRGFAYGETSITIGAEKTPETYSLEDTESFESSLGDWSNVAGNVSDWIRNSGGTTSGYTGPSSAYNGSYYIYIETSGGGSNTASDEDIIEYDIGSTTAGYLDFYYHQYGGDQGTLYLEGWDGSTWTEIWSSSGDQGNQWNHVEQADTEFTGYSKLRFRNVAAGGYKGDVALDLIKVYTGTAATYYTLDDYDNKVEDTGTYGTGAFTKSLTGLDPSTTYYVRAYAINSAGTGYGSEVGFATEAAAETYTITPSIDALLKALDSKTVSLDARLRATDSNSVSLDALLRATDAESVTLDALLRAIVTDSVVLDALLRAVDSKNISLDALLRAIVTDSVVLDALLRATDAKSITLDAILGGELLKAIVIDALLRATDSKTASLDALLKATDSSTLSLDALLRATDSESVTLDALLRAVGSTDIALDALLKAIATDSVTLDALLKATDSQSISLDALLGGGLLKAIVIDALLRATDSKTLDLDAIVVDRNHLQLALDALLRATDSSDVALDALLRASDSRDITLDALLKATASTGVDLDALLVGRFVIAINLDAVLRATDSQSISLDAILGAVGLSTITVDLDAVLLRKEHRAPFSIEVRTSSGALLGVIKDILDGRLDQATNLPDVLSFSIPASELCAQYVTGTNLLYVRDSASGEIISICRRQIDEVED